MKHNLRLRLALLLISLVLSLKTYAGAWMQEQGNMMAIASMFGYQSCSYWRGSGGVAVDSPCYNSLAISPYVEYGLTKNLTLGGAVYGQMARQLNNNYNLSNLQLLGRYKLWSGGYSVLSTQFTAFIPAFNSSSINSPSQASASSINIYPNNFNLEGRLLFGTGGEMTKSSHWYLDLEGAYGASINNYGTTIHLDGSFGWKLADDRVILELKSLNTFNTNDAVLGQLTPPFGFYNISTIVPSVGYQLTPRFALQLGLYQDVWGGNIGQGIAPFISVSWRFGNVYK